VTVGAAHFLACALIALLAGVAVLQLTGRRRLVCWLLALVPASLCAGCLVDLARGVAKIGEGAYQGDLKQLAYCLAFLAVAEFAAFRQQWRWLFWIAWVLAAFISGILVYLAFFWNVFS
jgi:hypothetical protein